MTASNGSTALATTSKPTELVQLGEMSVAGIIDRKKKIVEVMKAVMVEGEHYGKIPGCGDKPSLFKAGAEVLATVFGMAPQLDVRRTDLANGHREYEVTVTLVHIATGAVVGQGVGCCSTMESKYRWRNAARKCPRCGKAGPLLKSKKEGEGYFCWTKKDGCGAQFPLGDKSIEDQEVGRVENPDVADTYNTVLKMAKKRAQVDCTLTAVGASDVLTQDLEDLAANANMYAPPTAIDAEFKDRPDRPAPPANGDSKARGSDTTPADDLALELLAEINNARSEGEVRALSSRCNALPKGSRARTQVRQAFDSKLSSFAQGGGR